MAYINVPEGVPGIRSLVMFRPETGKYLYDLVEVLLRGESPLSQAERELIAAYVSRRNQCIFEAEGHAAAARCMFDESDTTVDDVLSDLQAAKVSPKFKALLHIAGKVQIQGTEVTPSIIQLARVLGATDEEIHDTVLIAAAFCMFNRYVDGLGSFTPKDPEAYKEIGKRLMSGYVLPTRQ